MDRASDEQFNVADAMAQVARTLEAPMGLAETLTEITNIVREAVPGVMTIGAVAKSSENLSNDLARAIRS